MLLHLLSVLSVKVFSACAHDDGRTVQVRRRHRLGTVVTPYHIREAAEHLGLGMEDVRECVQEVGGTVWDEDDDQVKSRLAVLAAEVAYVSFRSKRLRLARFGSS